MLSDGDQSARWDPDRAGIESAAHEVISAVIAAHTAAIRRFTAISDTEQVQTLTRQRHASAQLRSSITELGTDELTNLLQSLQATAEQLRAATA
ncbi:hypothetical protein Areg01_81630 [Actinoplanes regularis]|nr:hypothetical protein Areg01_81630 [Actinoplanes regularis]